jgi:hypothetical protein
MSALYFIIVPIFIAVVFSRVKLVLQMYKSSNKEAVSVNLFFLLLIFSLTALLVFFIETK